MDRTVTIRNYLEKNPEASYKDFKRDVKVKVTGQYFYFIRKKLRGDTAGGRKSRNRIYVSLFLTEKPTPEALKLLKEFIEVMNSRKKSCMELVEYANSKIEVREMQ